ncbi:MAG: transposase [Chitinispirillales bacterium]|nr:transposase [Chitinispirillales bacterium]
MFLPPYSPDLNPIELMWSKMKSKIKEIEPSGKDELIQALNTALECVTNDDVRNWIRHDGYRTQKV